MSYTALSAGSYSCVITKSGCGSITVAVPSLILYVSTYTMTATASQTTICNGTATILSASPNTSSFGYQWKLNGSNVAGATTANYSTTAAGTYTCFVTQPCGTTTSNSVVITVNPAATASITAGGSTNLCNGASVTLNANTGVGLTYQWTVNGVNVTGATSAAYTTNVGGTYRCVVTNSSGCSATSTFINVFTGAGATAAVTPSGNVNFCAGSSLTLSANTGLAAGISIALSKSLIMVSHRSAGFPSAFDGLGVVEFNNFSDLSRLYKQKLDQILPNGF